MAQVFRVTIHGNTYGSPFQNVVHFETADDALTALQAATEVRNEFVGLALNTGIKSWCSASTIWTSVVAQRVWPALGVAESLVFAQLGQQAQHSEMFLQNCIILRIQADAVGRRGRGRVYCPTVLPGFTTNGFIDQTFFDFAQTALVGMRVRFLRDFNPTLLGPLFLVVAPREFPGLRSVALSLNPSNKTGTQRRRNW